MSSSDLARQHPVEPLVPIGELLDWLASAAFHLTLGVTVGLLAAGVMRRRHLHWTWAATGLAVLMLTSPSLGVSSTMLDSAAFCATLRARRRHREDLMAGGDLYEMATSRCGPLGILRSASRSVLLRFAHPSSRDAVRGGRIDLGRDEHGCVATVPFGVPRSGAHTLVVGATGSGKTVTETWIASQAIQAGFAAVVIDPKGDSRMRAQLAEAAAGSGRRFIEWTANGPSVYNPFGHGSASALADKALAGERFTEPHYQRQAQRYLGHAVRALRDTGSVVSLRALVEQLDPSELDALARRLPADRATATHRYLNSLTQRQRADLGGVRDRLAIIAESDVAPWLDPLTPGARAFDLLGAIREQAVVYFALEADSLPLLTHMLGVTIVQDLLTVVAALQRAPIQTVVVIDEFAAIAAEQAVRLFGRARSAGVNLVLGTQELSDLRPDANRQLQEQILGNLASLVAHRQVVSESVELVSSLAGSRGDWRTSQASDGRWTRTRTTAPVLAAKDIRGLGPGRAAVVELGASSSARIVEVFSSTGARPESRPALRGARIGAAGVSNATTRSFK